MTITKAQQVIDLKLNCGVITADEAKKLSILIRRVGDYGHQWSWGRQAKMRALVVA